MGQYMKPVNVSKKEYFHPVGGMKAIERLTNPVAMGMVGFLLLEGPQDGTVFSGLSDPDDPQLQDEIERLKERERAAEEEKEGYYNPYREDDGSWNEHRITRTAAAGFAIDEANEYAGRWAGDDVRLVGDYADVSMRDIASSSGSLGDPDDYADNDLYSTTNENWVYEYEGEEFVNYATASAPVVPSSIEREDIVHSVRDEDVEPGDLCHVDHPETGEKVYAHFVEVADSEWTNITDGLEEEFVEFVGEDWIKSQDKNGLFRPDMILSS